MNPKSLTFLSLILFLTACDQLGIETPAQQNLRVVAEGKAVGSSCRQAGRALEDCYQLSPKASKAAIFDGWREMDAYMRDNKLDEIAPKFPLSPPAGKSKTKPVTEEEAPADSHGAKKADEAAPSAPVPAAPEKHTSTDQPPVSAGRRTI